MDERDFMTRIKKIKAEILALKQAFKYGLGRADFPREDLTLEVGTGTHNIEITIVSKNLNGHLPFIELIGTALQSATINLNEDTITITGPTANYGSSATIRMTVIMAAPIISAAIEEI